MAGAQAARFRLGAIEIDRVTLDGAVDAVDALVTAARGGAVFTPNVDHVVLAEDDAALREAYRHADLCVADGMPLVWASRLLRERLPEKVSGSDLVLPVAERAAARGWRTYLLGGPPGVATVAAERLRERFPAIVIVGTDAPRIGADGGGDESTAAIERIRAARPHLVLVGFGAPKQELWIHRNLDRLRPAVAIGIGASLDFLAGRVRRAPRWVSEAGFEWLWRLVREPRRLWRRYLVKDPKFALIVLREARARRRAR